MSAKTVYVEQESLLPEFNRNVPFWYSLDNVYGPPNGKLIYDSSPGYYNQTTGEELLPEEFVPESN